MRLTLSPAIFLLGLANAPNAIGSAEFARQTDANALSSADALAELRELAELDLIGELIPQGRAWTQAGALLENNGEARAIVAEALHAAGEEAEAIRLLNAKTLAPAEQAFIELEQARLFLELDQLESALEKLTDSRAAADGSVVRELRHPDIAITWLLLARTYARAGDLRHAAPAAQEFLKRAPLHPEAPSAWHLLASAALELQDAERAERYLARARESENWHAIFSARRMQLRRSPKDPLPRLGLGMAWMQVRAFDRAQVEFEQLVDEHPTYSRGWFHLGEAFRLQNDLNAAYEAYQRALETDSSQHLARYNLAIIDLMQNRAEKAQIALELLMGIPEIESDPRFLDAHKHLAKLYEALGETERAKAQEARYRELAQAAK